MTDTKTLRMCAKAHADAGQEPTAQLLTDAADHIDALTNHNNLLSQLLKKQIDEIAELRGQRNHQEQS